MYVPASFAVWKYSLLCDKIKKICYSELLRKQEFSNGWS